MRWGSPAGGPSSRWCCPPPSPASCRASSWLSPGSSIAFLVQNRILRPSGHRPRSNWLAADPHHPEHLWTLVTAWMSSPRTPLIGLLLLLTLGIAMERRLGARRFLVTALPSHVCGVGLALVCHPIIAPMWPTWGQQLLSRSVAGVSLLLLGPFMVVAGTMNATWRRRIHWLTLLTAILIVGVTGKPTTIAWLGAVSAGIVFAGPLARPLTPDTAIPATPHSERNMVALIVCAWAGVLILTVLSREPGLLIFDTVQEKLSSVMGSIVQTSIDAFTKGVDMKAVAEYFIEDRKSVV